jgi:hypothetical protein
MNGKLAITCLKYQGYLYGSEAFTYLNAFFVFFLTLFNTASNTTVPEDAGIEPRVRSHPHSAVPHPHSARSHPHSARSHPHLAKSHAQLGKISSTLGQISSTRIPGSGCVRNT